MAGPRITEGVRVPLFDRLVATAAHPRTGDDRHDRRMLDRAATLLRPGGRGLSNVAQGAVSLSVHAGRVWVMSPGFFAF